MDTIMNIDMLFFLDNIMYAVLDLTIIAIIYSALSNHRIFSSPKKLLFALPIILIPAMASTFVDSQTFSSTLMSILVLLFYTKNFDVTFLDSLCIYITCNVFMIFVQIPYILILTMFEISLSGGIANIAGNIICGIIIYILCKLGIVGELYNFAFHRNAVTRNIFIGFFVLSMIISMYKRLDLTAFMNNILSITSVAIAVSILYVGLYKNHMELQQKQKQLDAYGQYLPIVEGLIEQVRERQHDFNNEIQAIKALPFVYDNYETLSSALSDEIAAVEGGQMIESSRLLKINTKLIAGFLFSRRKSAAADGICLDIDVKNNVLTSNVQEFILLDIMSILIDNAVEAVPKGGKVSVLIDSDGHRVHIDTYNEGPAITADMRKKFFTKGFSTKDKKESGAEHGIGLYKLSQLIDKYDGSITLDNRTSDDGGVLVHFGVDI